MTTLTHPLFRLQSREYKLFISHAWTHSDDYDGLVNLLNGEGGLLGSFRWINFSIPKSDPLETHPVLTKSHRYLVHRIDEQIGQVDCVLVIAGMYVKYRGWIQSEIDAALEFSKPIIAVYPYRCERVPSELSNVRVTKWVGWRGSSITSAIREHAPTPASIPLAPSNRLGALTALMPSSKGGAVPLGIPASSETYPLLNLLGELNPPKKSDTFNFLGIDPLKEPDTYPLQNLFSLFDPPKK